MIEFIIDEEYETTSTDQIFKSNFISPITLPLNLHFDFEDKYKYLVIG